MELSGFSGTPRLGRAASAVVAAVVALLGGLGVAAVSTDGAFPTSAIAAYAVAHFAPGSSGGECIVFVERVVDAVYRQAGLRHSFPGADAAGYYQAFAGAGGQLVGEAGPGGYAAALAGAQRGDIVQLSPLPASAAAPWVDPGGGHEHTAILLAGSGGSAGVIDSNWRLDLRVRIHPLSDVVADASRWGLEMAVWGFGIPGG